MPTSLGMLTEKQLIVLALASRKTPTSRIAALLSVTRQDVSITLRRARKRIEEARKTIEAYLAASSTIVKAPCASGTEAIARLVLEKADELGVKLRVGRSELPVLLKAKLSTTPRLCPGDGGEACVAITQEGLVEPVDCSIVERVEEILEKHARKHAT